MDEIKLSLSQTGPSGELSVIRVDGVVDTITASELETVIEKLVGQRRYKILIDLGGVEYISSAGWGIFISRIQEIRENEGDIKLANMIPNVYEIYELLEFENIIPAFETLDQGKKAFNITSPDDGDGERVWKAEDKMVPETGTSIQAAMSPGTKGRSSDIGVSIPRTHHSNDTSSLEGLIRNLIVDDPFYSISELAEEARKAAPKYRAGWWKVFGVLRREGLLRRRSRYRLARRLRKQ